MVSKILNFLTDASSLSIAIPLIVGLILFKRLNRSQRLLLGLVITSSITEILANLLISLKSSNLPVYNTYTLVNLNLIFCIYLSKFNKGSRHYLTGYLIFCNLFAIVNVLFFQPITSYNSNLLVLVSITFLLLALNYFYRLLKEVKYQRLERNPLFWLSSGIVLYYSGTLVLFFLSNQISQADPGSQQLILASWGLNSIFNLILVTSYTITLWVKPTK